MIEKSLINPKKLLWKDFYTGLKPHCWGCLKKGITIDQYAFCSPEKEPLSIHEENEWGKKGKLLGTFEVYKCNVYHWTLFQGQGRIKSLISKNPYKTPIKNSSSKQNYITIQNQLKL